MIEVKCFTFFTTHKILLSEITKIKKEKHTPIIEIDKLELIPSLSFTCTNPKINEFDANDMLQGFFEEIFSPIEHKMVEDNENIIINSIFVLQFGLNTQISLKDNKITYVEEREYSYHISPSFCEVDCPPLTTSINIDSEKQLIIKEEIKAMIM